MTFQIITDDALTALREMPSETVDCCITSPPYWGLRDYGHAGQMGLEPTPAEYVAAMVALFREVRRTLRDDGTLWLNLGDSTIKKNLVDIPWRVALALQADGWMLRSDIIWNKPNPMPESVTDRPTRAHEYLFLLAKSERYYYDTEAIKEPGVAMNEHDATGPGYRAPGQAPQTGSRKSDKQRGHSRRHAGFNDRWDAMPVKEQCSFMRNRRDVWVIAPQPFKGAHFAVMPEALVAPCVLAGCPEGGLVLDPFTGSGTVGVVALREGRNFVGIELNPEYSALATKRIAAALPGPRLFNEEPA
jgi:site-specific DNA-methyltransferase (adenine-specific)